MKTSNQIISESGADRIKVIKLSGEVIEDVTLKDLMVQAGDISQFDTLVLEIASPGGSVSEGLSTMVWLENLSKQEKRIVTIVTANAYSIASLIMLVADIKLISKHGKVMVHNPMVPLLEYVNANDLQEYIDSLRSLEDTMYQLYGFFTGLDKEQIKVLMDNETYLLPDEAVNAGFADMVVDIKPKSYQMTSNIKKEINMSNTLNILNKVIGMVNKSEFINQLYSDLAGAQIEIFQKDPSTYMVGDRTSKEDGQVLLSDGAKLNIVAYKIESIDRGTETPDVAVDAVAKEVVAEEPKVEAAFNEGEAPKEAIVEGEPAVQYAEPKAAVEGEPVVEPAPVVEPVQVVEEPAVEEAPVPAEEAMDPIVEAVIEDIIEDEPKVEDAPVEEPAKDEDADEPKAEVEEGQEPFQVTEEHMQAMHAEMASMQERIAKLEAICMGYDNRFLEMSKFEDIATEAIDTLATNAVSNFKPDAVAPKKAKFEPKGSIFNQLKKKRNLN